MVNKDVYIYIFEINIYITSNQTR